MKSSFIEGSSASKLQYFLPAATPATPMKSDKFTGSHTSFPGIEMPFEDHHHLHHLLGSYGKHSGYVSSNVGPMGDTAFQLYCEQNLSPINNFPFASRTTNHHTPHVLASPDPTKPLNHQQYQRHVDQQGRKIFASPGITSHMLLKPHQGSGIGRNIQNQVRSSIGGSKFIRDEIYDETTDLKNSNKPMPSPFAPQSGSAIRQPSYKRGQTTQSSTTAGIGNEKEEKCYTLTSPVFKIKFSGRSQLEEFLRSQNGGSEFIEEISLEHYSSLRAKQIDGFEEDGQTELPPTYKRVIQFNDDEISSGQSNDHRGGEEMKKNDSRKQQPSQLLQQQQISTRRLTNRQRQQQLQKEQQQLLMQVPPTQLYYEHEVRWNSKKLNLFEEVNLASQNSHTTAKKSRGGVEDTTIQSVITAQKRKLFESPYQAHDDFQTPSTKKKKKVQPISEGTQQNFPVSRRKGSQNNISLEDSAFKHPLSIMHDSSRKGGKNRVEEEALDESSFQVQESSSHIPCSSEEKKICCNCKRSKCLKLYCECFAAFRVCEGCSCQGCYNKPEFESMRQEARNSILDRNSSAFDSKIEQSSKVQVAEETSIVEGQEKVHSKGCNCKMSNCQKKYCECFQLGVRCTKLCKCENCKNTGQPHIDGESAADRKGIQGAGGHSEFQRSENALKANHPNSRRSGIPSDYASYYYNQDNYYSYYYPQYSYGAYPYYDYYGYPQPIEGQEIEGEEIDAPVVGYPPNPPRFADGKDIKSHYETVDERKDDMYYDSQNHHALGDRVLKKRSEKSRSSKLIVKVVATAEKNQARGQLEQNVKAKIENIMTDKNEGEQTERKNKGETRQIVEQHIQKSVQENLKIQSLERSSRRLRLRNDNVIIDAVNTLPSKTEKQTDQKGTIEEKKPEAEKQQKKNAENNQSKVKSLQEKQIVKEEVAAPSPSSSSDSSKKPQHSKLKRGVGVMELEFALPQPPTSSKKRKAS